MITRVLKWRPRRFAVIGAGIVAAAGLFAAMALALVSDSGSFSVEVPNKDTSSGLVLLGDPGSASVEYIGSSAANEASGTGLFDPFVRLQGSPTEKGYNTDGAVAFDTKSGTWTHAIKAQAIPIVDCDGSGGPGTATCWELFVDINESNTAKYISLNEVEIWFTTDPNLVGYVDPTGFPSGATQVYDFTGEIKIHDVNQGSGRGDLRYLIPLANIDPFDSSTYFVLYSKWGTSTQAAPDGKTYGSEGGFEEWKVRKAPNVSILKTANPVGPVNAGGTIGFDITVSNTGAAAAPTVSFTDSLPAGAALSWSLVPPFSGCSITGNVGSQVLTCSFSNVAAGATIGPIHVQSATTAADCAVVPNTAILTAGGTGQSSASVTVQCAAIRILKQSTKTGNPLVTDAGDGALFTVTPPAGSAFTVRDNDEPSAGGKSDESSTFGEVCISGLAPGTYTVSETTPPSGYGAGTASDNTATAAVGTSCTAPNKPTDLQSAVFTNPPLGEITVGYHDLGSGETSATISCAKGANTLTAQASNLDDDITGYLEAQAFTFNPVDPGTYTCTLIVDP